MSTPVVPRRKWLQVHLSTAIILMFVTGGLIWANVTGRIASYAHDPRDFWHNTFGFSINYGWPFAVFMDIPYESNGNYSVTYTRDYSMIPVDVLIALAVLLIVWFVCEWLIRHRAARKGD